MGNWRTVRVVGTCATEDKPALARAIRYDRKTLNNFHCLTATDGVCSLGNWATFSPFDRVGNLAERDYDVEDVAEQLRELVKVAPSLTVKVHCGGDYEDKTCVNTVTLENGVVTVGEPEIENVGELDTKQMEKNLFSQLYRQAAGE